MPFLGKSLRCKWNSFWFYSSKWFAQISKLTRNFNRAQHRTICHCYEYLGKFRMRYGIIQKRGQSRKRIHQRKKETETSFLECNVIFFLSSFFFSNFFFFLLLKVTYFWMILSAQKVINLYLVFGQCIRSNIHTCKCIAVHSDFFFLL